MLLAAAVSSMGAFAFGYHLGILNGPLAEMSVQLGFAGNPQLSGLVRASALQHASCSTQCSSKQLPQGSSSICETACDVFTTLRKGRTHHGCVSANYTTP